MNHANTLQRYHDVIAFWFPDDNINTMDAQQHRHYWRWRLLGGADEEIVSRFTKLSAHAAAGHCQQWVTESYGRLALIIVLDQFSRSVWRGTVNAYAQDEEALRLCLDGLNNGHYDLLATPWHKIAFTQPLGHCEGPDHLERMDLLIRLREGLLADVPQHLMGIYDTLVQQARDVRQVIATFGRHPHRNHVLGRPSTRAEEAYIAEQRFPHVRVFSGDDSVS
ncbi:MAG TPA: DUF924 family protein [Paenalcaligenes sp.]|nr:DUF924 family protein [Paenalcaligenes sp.]